MAALRITRQCANDTEVETFEHFRHRYIERCGQSHQHMETRGLLGSLQVADVVAVQAGLLGERLLR